MRYSSTSVNLRTIHKNIYCLEILSIEIILGKRGNQM